MVNVGRKGILPLDLFRPLLMVKSFMLGLQAKYLIEIQASAYRDDSIPKYSSKKMSGRSKSENMTFKRGFMFNDNAFFDWSNAGTWPSAC